MKSKLSTLTWVRERAAYTREEIINCFGKQADNKTDADALLVRLLQQNIVKQRSSTNINSDEENEASLLDTFIGKGDYVFSYVGLYCYKGHLVYSLPKYEQQFDLHRPERQNEEVVADSSRMQVFSQLVQVIRHYETKRTENLDNLLQEKETDNYLAQLVSIVTDYAENGEYRDDEQRIATNEHGRILWERTINLNIPHMQDDEPIYMDTYTRRLVDAEDHFITRLHRLIVKECCHQLQTFGLIDLLDLPVVEAIEEDVEELGENAYLIHCLENELSSQFDSRRRHILKTLKAYLEKRHCRDDEAQEEYFFGSTAFHCIWEDVCREVMGDDARNEYSIESPEWKFMENNELKASTDNMEQDIIIERKDSFWLFDAKYYLPTYSKISKKIFGLPGNQDVTKQFLYQQDLSTKSTKHIHNAFLMPQPTGYRYPDIHLYAKTRMELFNQMEPIKTFRLNAQKMFTAYISPNFRASIQDQMNDALNAPATYN